MRFVTALLLWLVTTVLLAAALPAAWAQKNLVDQDGYAAGGQGSPVAAGGGGGVEHAGRDPGRG